MIFSPVFSGTARDSANRTVDSSSVRDTAAR